MFASSLVMAAALTAVQTPDGWRMQRADGTVLLEQHAAAGHRAYIHPLMAPDGRGVYTENEPMHHPWQHGLYVGLHAVNGINFWEKEQNKFHPEPVAKPTVEGSTANWKVRTRWTDQDGSPVLTETQEWTLTDHGTNYVLDLTWTLSADFCDVTFGKWAYGGLFLRMPYKKANAKRQFAVNSRGQRNAAAEQQPAEWVEVSMPIEGRDRNGVVRIEEMPGNPGYPNPWRVDGQLGIAPSHCIRGPWRLSKGESRKNRYRVTVKDAAEVRRFVTYEEFGAVGDGKADDQKAIVAAHRAANEKGLPVRAGDGRTYYIGRGSEVAVIKTDVDFGTAEFVIDDRELDDLRAPVFRVDPSGRPFDLRGVAALAPKQKSLGVPLPGPCLVEVKNANVKHYIRYGRNQNSGTPQKEMLLVAASGAIDPRTPVIWGFGTVTGARAHPVDRRPLVVKGGRFTTIANQAESNYRYHGRGIAVRRSNVRIEGVRHYVKGEGGHGAPYGGFVSVSFCADVTVTNCVFTAHRTYSTIGSAGKPVSMGSYDVSVNSSVNVSFIDCRQTTDINDRRYWGLFGSNFCRNLLFDGCEFSRFDAHMGVANATIRNSRLGHMGINAIGFGTFLVENTTVCSPSFFNLRSDYGSTWRGDFIVRNCTFVPGNGNGAQGTLVHGSSTDWHDFGYPCEMPRRIVFDGLRIEDSCHPAKYDGPRVFSMFNGKNKGPEYVEKFPYKVAEEVVLRNVTTASGKDVVLGPNKYMFRNVRVVR